MPAVVAVNRRPGDTNEEVELVKRLALEAGAFAAEANEGFTKGGAGVADLAEAVVAATRGAEHASISSTRTTRRSRTRSRRSQRRCTGPRTSTSTPRRRRKLSQFTREGMGHFPVCMAKTHLSLSADPSLLNAPENFTLPVRDIRAYTGAGWLVPLCGDIVQMPGLGKDARGDRTSTSTPRAGPSAFSERSLEELLDDSRRADAGARGRQRSGLHLRARRRAGRDGSQLRRRLGPGTPRSRAASASARAGGDRAERL